MLSEADKLFAQLDEVIYGTWGVRGVYNNRVIVDVMLDRDVIRENSYGESIRNNFEITVRNTQVKKLAKGDTVDIAADRYEIVDIVYSDSANTIGEAVHVPG